MYSSRLSRLQDELANRNLDGYALNPGPSLYYLTGVSFHLMERPIVCLVPRSGQPALVLPEMERLKAEASALDLTAFAYGENPEAPPQAFSSALESLGLVGARVGIEPLRLRTFEANLIEVAAPDLSLVAAGELMAGLRACKNELEINSIRRAVSIAEAALEATLPLIQLGMTERQVGAELVVQLLRRGSDSELPFQPIVASGPNSAHPHATSSERPLAAGELLLIDWGAGVDGYCSDLTRTFALAEVDDEMRAIHRAVLNANEAGRQAVAPNISCGFVDAAAREQIEAAGFGDQFIHRTGHGIGLEAHELPYLHAGNESALAPGMVLTVEPGIYLPERGGLRIEDDVLVTEAGRETLSTRGRELEVLA